MNSAAGLKNHLYRNHSEFRNGQRKQFVKCPHCHIFVNYERSLFLSHVYLDIKKYGNIECPLKNCPSIYNKSRSFQSHVVRCHPDWKSWILKDAYCFQNECDSPDYKNEIDIVLNMSDDLDQTDSHNLLPFNFEQQFNEVSANSMNFIARLSLKMEVKLNMTKTAVSEVLNDIVHLLQMNSLHKFRMIESILSSSGMEDIDIDLVFKEYTEYKTDIEFALSGAGILSSAHRRKMYILNSEDFVKVKPIEYSAGIKNGNEHFYSYIPILDSLKYLLKHQSILSDILQVIKPVPLTLQDFSDGRFCKKNALFGSKDLTLKINLYVDEIEICNPIGAFKGIHKMSCFYWTLLNIHPSHRSQLQAIQPCILISYLDMKEFTLEKTIKPLIDDIKILEDTGIFVEKLDTFVKGSVAYLSGDNLSGNTFGGFSISFASNNARNCRCCMIQKKDIGNKNIDPCMRTKDTYNYHVNQIAVHESSKLIYGIHSECPLNKLKYFHAAEGIPPDPMHDLLEGIVPYELALVFRQLIIEKYFDFDTLNFRVEQFNFNRSDQADKTYKISQNFRKTKTIGGTASMNHSLLRYLPFMIGDLVPNDGSCKFWTLILTLKNIVEITLSPQLTLNMISYLKYEIESHISLFKDIFPDERLKMKHHYIEHYPDAILNYGPLINCWCMRFEAKHKYFKNVIKRANNFKNPTKTAAEKHCLLMTYFLSNYTFFNSEIDVRNSNYTNRSSIDIAVCAALDKISGNRDYYVELKEVSIKGIKYQKNQILVIPNTKYSTNFVQIKSIWFLEQKAFFWCQHCKDFFNGHLHVYELIKINFYSLFSYDNLHDYYPLNLYSIPGNSQAEAISLHHGLRSLF